MSLRNEAVAADIRIANDALVIAGLTAERDALKAERADLLSLALQAKRHHDKVVAELEMSKLKTYAASISPIAKERDAEIEQLRVQLAGCGVAAMQNTESSKAGRVKRGDFGWSESYGDVCRMVDREIAQRAVMQQALDALELHATQYPHMQKGYTVDAITALKEAMK